ncbi:NAD(P)-binding protein [Mycena kentingensis (nom. inval.)]|nr:NAD(P)-binding protein [Mycena kentingensis (nom. inval.)]
MGVTWSQFFPPKPTFSTKDVPDLTGQVMLVTGGSSGIGKELVKVLLEHNAKVYIAGRAETTKRAIVELKAETGKEAEFLEMDLADLVSVKRAAETFRSQEPHLNVLFNNAGVMRTPLEMITEQGYDLQFGVNVLAHFYLTTLLLPTLEATATASARAARIVHTSSLLQVHTPPKFDMDTLKTGEGALAKRTKVGTSELYIQSKFGNAVLSEELHRRYADKGIVSVAINPGNINSNLARHWKLSPVAEKLLRMLLYPLPYGALTPLYAGTTRDGELLGGKFLFPWARLGEVPPSVKAPENGETLWKWCEEQVAAI